MKLAFTFPGDGTAEVIKANALDLPLDDASVDLIITSPPYFALRSYQDDGEHYDGQLGSEPTPAAFLDALIAATREMMRVLKPSGSMWINLGDKYAGSGGHNNAGISDKSTLSGNGHKGGIGKAGPQKIKATQRNAPDAYNKASDGIRTKSLMGMPWRYAIRCIDELGLILRAEVIWCLSGGTKVYARTPTGDRPIMLRDLYRAYRPNDVQLWNGEKWTQVSGWNQTPRPDDAIEIELRSGERIGSTRNHEWLTQRGLVRTDELTVGDVVTTTTLPSPESPKMPNGLDDELVGWFVGLYLAEGSRSDKTIQIAGHIDEVLRLEQLRRIAETYDGACHVYQTSDRGVTVNLSGAILRGILDRYVSEGTARTKRLAVNAWQRSNEFLAAVMTGYLSGDGHYDAKNDRWRLGFCDNDELAGDMRTMAARLGARISLRRSNHHLSDRTFPGWRGEWRWQGGDTHHNSKDRGQIVAIRQSRARHFYDVGVADEPHLFALASGVLTHNSKPNGLPESVRDRVRRSHEQWFHFTKEPQYFAAIDEVREAHALKTLTHRGGGQNWGNGDNPDNNWSASGIRHPDPLGKLPGSVWSIPSEPLKVPEEIGIDHFAAFPTEFPRRIILGWSPNGVCVACGEGRTPVVDATQELIHKQKRVRGLADLARPNGEGAGAFGPSSGDSLVTRRNTTITGYACACPDITAATKPAVVLDPFGGTGTVAMVAKALGRHGISVDLSADYCRLAEWRTNDPDSLNKVRGKSKKQLPRPKPATPVAPVDVSRFLAKSSRRFNKEST